MSEYLLINDALKAKILTEGSATVLTDKVLSPKGKQNLEALADVMIIVKGSVQAKNIPTNSKLKMRPPRDAREAFDLQHVFMKRTIGVLPPTSPFMSFPKFQKYYESCTFMHVITDAEKVVGMTLLNLLEKNPYDGTPSLHIGFFGYHHEVDPLASRSIKETMIAILNQHNPHENITAIVSPDNRQSLNFSKNMGLKTIGYIFIKKIEPKIEG